MGDLIDNFCAIVIVVFIISIMLLSGCSTISEEERNRAQIEWNGFTENPWFEMESK